MSMIDCTELEPLNGHTQQKGDPWLMTVQYGAQTGYATLHYTERWWALGVQPNANPADQVGPYKRHGWRRRMEADAAHAIRQLLQSETIHAT